MTGTEIIWDISLTATGTIIGFIAAIWNERKVAAKEFKTRRTEVLKDLLKSLEKNQVYLNQITDLHFASGELPTFPLDTVALSFVALNARQYLPHDTKLGEKYNDLRFELDHINRKTQNLLTFSSILLPTDQSNLLYDGTDGVLHKSIAQMVSLEFGKLKTLIEQIKGSLSDEIKDLRAFVKS